MENACYKSCVCLEINLTTQTFPFIPTSIKKLPSLHTAVYLPTAGKDGDWLATIMDLESHVMENVEKYGEVAVKQARRGVTTAIHLAARASEKAR